MCLHFHKLRQITTSKIHHCEMLWLPHRMLTRMLWSQFHIGCLGLRENFIAILTRCNSRCHDVRCWGYTNTPPSKGTPPSGGDFSPFENDYCSQIGSFPKNKSNNKRRLKPSVVCKKLFTPHMFYTRHLLHQSHFPSSAFCTRDLLYQTSFTGHILHKRQFTPDGFYTRHNLHLRSLTPKTFHTKHLLHEARFTPNMFYTRKKVKVKVKGGNPNLWGLHVYHTYCVCRYISVYIYI